MANGRQLVSEKKRKEIAQLLGYCVIAAYMNGDIPHGCAIAWTTPEDAHLVNFKTRVSRKYITAGKYEMRRAVITATVSASAGVANSVLPDTY
jgi:hypothetical protein